MPLIMRGQRTAAASGAACSRRPSGPLEQRQAGDVVEVVAPAARRDRLDRAQPPGQSSQTRGLLPGRPHLRRPPSVGPEEIRPLLAGPPLARAPPPALAPPPPP